MDKSHLKDILYSNMFRVLSFLLVLIGRLGSLLKLLFRFHVGKASVHEHEIEDDSIGGERQRERERERERERVSSASSSKYQVLSGRGISGFLEEPKTLNFTVHQVSDGLSGGKEEEFELSPEKAGDSVLEKTEKTGEVEEIPCPDKVLDEEQNREFYPEDVIDEGVSGNEVIGRNDLDSEVGKTEETEYSVSGSAIPEIDSAEGNSPDIGLEEDNSDSGIARESSEESVTKEAEMFNDVGVHEEEEVIGLATEHDQDGKQESVGSNDDLDRTSEVIDWFANISSSEGFQPESPIFTDEDDDDDDDDQDRRRDFMKFTDTDEEDYIELKLPHPRYEDSSDDDVWSEEDLRELEQKHGDQVPVHEEVDSVSKSHKSSDSHELEHEHQEDLKPSSSVELQHDSQDLDSDSDTYEHEDIIEQLKMELKNARTGGLPTIQEESETEESSRTPPPIMQELRPLKIQEKKFEHRDHMEEIQKVYKSYSDRMRKLDVLNCQTMHALGLYQMKEPYQFQASRKYWAPAMKSVISHNFFSCKQVANVVDPSKKAIADMHMDFETSYVGQLCLSWEMLHWQYRKTRELQDHEPPGSHHYYHQVAGEFQHFGVLIHRFLENEPFQGPRVEQYVKSRCILRNLLQVPVIRDDNSKDKGKRGDGEDLITIHILTDIIEETMWVFWEFLRSDKEDPSPSSFNINHHHQPVPTSPPDISDSHLLIDARSHLQKKEKKLKEIMRSRNCLVKKFQKHHGEGTSHITLLVAQVELRLVWRVLHMPKITSDQLLWCHEKLDKINLSNRKVSVEPSFLLFPC